MRIGLIGCGAVGSAVALAVARGEAPGIELIGIADAVESEATRRTTAATACPFTNEVRTLIGWGPDLIVEAASQAAVGAFAALVLEARIDLMIVSVGALADAGLFAQLSDLARRSGRHLYVPPGAIGGIDIIRGAAIGGLDECRLTTTKPLGALAGAGHLTAEGVDLNSVTRPTIVYEGPAADAVRLFPQNINVAATVSLAGMGLQRTVVRIIADPEATRNVHEVYLRGRFGEATIRLCNLPSPDNPKTSYLTSLSVIAALRRLTQPVQLGA